MNKDYEILLGLTTTRNSSWQDKINEIKQFKIKRIAFFPTVLKIEERKRLYKLLEDSPIEEIPHVHLREDMAKWELELFEKRFLTKYYNVHEENINQPVFKKYLAKIYIENLNSSIKRKNLKKCAGLCLDFSHLERTYQQNWKVYEEILELAKEYPISCCHISAKKNPKHILKRLMRRCGSHFLMDFKELDYMKKYLDWLPSYISLELENSFAEQLHAKEYLEKIMEEK